MDILIVLRKLGELEKEAGRLYEWLSSVVAFDEKAKEFFLKLSADEKSHLDLVKYQERVVRKSPKDFGEVQVNMPAIDTTLSKIAEFRKTSPTFREAMRFALDIETEISEYYATTVMDQSNQHFAELTKSLSATQKDDHYKQLIRFAASCE